MEKVKRLALCFLLCLICIALLAPAALAAGSALSADRNGAQYDYVIGYCYSGSQQSINTREIFLSPNNYDVWLCSVCGLGDNNPEHVGTALASNLYMPCYGYDIAATGGDNSIRYALVRHRHNNGQLSDEKVYIPINVPMYSGCYYGYDLAEPTGVRINAPSAWQRDSVTVRFEGGNDTGTSLPDWSATPGDYGSGIHHYEYSINGGAWTGCPTNDPTVVISTAGVTTITARVVDGAGNASSQTVTAQVRIDNAVPNVPGITLSTEQWTNGTVSVALHDNGDSQSGIARLEYALDGGAWTTYSSAVSAMSHGRHAISARAIDNVGRISGTANKTALIDKVKPVVSEIEQIPNKDHTELNLNVTAADADSGIAGYAVTSENNAPPVDAFSASTPTVNKNGTYYVWTSDKAGNISAGTRLVVTALDIVPPTIVAVEVQQTWDAQKNWAKITAADDNSGVVAIGWSVEDGEIQWDDASDTATFEYTENRGYIAYARDLAGNISEPCPFTVDRIDKHSPVIDSVEWDTAWSQHKIITVEAHDDESGLGGYALTRTAQRPVEWQDESVFEISENGIYYLWVIDHVERVSADAGEGASNAPGPWEITVDTIDRSKPVMDSILHSAQDNAPENKFDYPHFNEVDRPSLMAHDIADAGWTDSGVKAIYYQFAEDEKFLGADWRTYDENEKPAMEDEYYGRIFAKAEDQAGNVSDMISAVFMFEQTAPAADYALTPNNWTNGDVKIRIHAEDDMSGVQSITLPDGTVVDADAAEYRVMQNGIYEFSVRDHCGNVLPYPVDVANIDLMPPTADYELLTDEWTNVPVTIRVKADDLSPEDGYAPSGIQSITLPDGEVVEADTADFIAEQNGSYDFIVTDNAGNTYTLHTEVSNIDYLSPQAQCTIDPGQWTNQPVAMHITATDPSPEDGYAPSGIQSITLPDGMVVDDSQAVFTADKNGKYDFVITDRGGNTFVLHTEVKIIDDLLPTAKYSVVPGKWTNESVTIEVTAEDPAPEDGYVSSGVKEIAFPDGTVIEGAYAEFTVHENGNYDFAVSDHGGNIFTLHAKVENVDTICPVVDYHFEQLEDGGHRTIEEYGEREYYNYDLVLRAQAEDSQSGIARYEYKIDDGEWTEFDASVPPVFEDEQISRVAVRVWDAAENVSEEKIREIILDKTPPRATHTLTPSDNGNININFEADCSISGIQSLVQPDGIAVYGGASTAVYEVDCNGDYDFTVWDFCGNQLTHTVTVSSFTALNKTQDAKPQDTDDTKPPQDSDHKQSSSAQPKKDSTSKPAPMQQKLSRALTLADLICMLLTLLLAILIWTRQAGTGEEESDAQRQKSCGFGVQKAAATLLASFSILLFFLTQPLVWRIQLFDWWTILFALLTLVVLVLLITCRRDKENAHKYEDTEDEEDFL